MQSRKINSSKLTSALLLFLGAQFSQAQAPAPTVLGTISLTTGEITAAPKPKTPITPVVAKDVAQKADAPVPAKAPAVKIIRLVPAPAEAEKQIIMPPAPVKRAESEVMPGIGTMPGENPELKNKVVKNSNERNEVAYISSQFTNRISTPFTNPQVIDKSNSEIEIVGQDIYLKPKTNEPIGIYITDESSRQTISLTLVPKNIPQQTLIAQLDAKTTSNGAGATPSDYVGKLNDLMKQIAQDKSPSGFTQASLPNSITKRGDLVVKPLVRFSGTVYDIYKYQLTNGSKSNLELQEESFYNQQNIKAIGFFPETVLLPGGSTTMIVISDRSTNGGD